MKDAPGLLDDLTAVNDRESFLAFVQALVADWEDSVRKEREAPSAPYGPAANSWENLTIGDLREAAAAGGEDARLGARQGLPVEPSWGMLARFLLAGKFYE